MRRTAALSIMLSIVCLVDPAAAQQNVMALRAERLGPQLTVLSGFANGNILVLTGPEGTLLVDAQSAKRVRLADSVLATLGAPPVRWVINTHYHGDHVEGNTLFQGRGAEIIGQEQLPIQMVKDTTITSWDNWHRTPAEAASIPTRTFRDSLTLRINGQQIVVTHIASAHTDGDAIVWLPDANVIHTGDLFEHQAPPFIDWWVGGRLGGMLAGVDWGLEHSDSATRIVPGHGPVGNRGDLLRYREMLLGVSTAVAEHLNAGDTLEETQAAEPAARWESLLGSPRRAGHLVALLYYGLKEFEMAALKPRLVTTTPEARLPWLIGCWETSRNGRTVAERWTVAADGSLVGAGRTTRNGTVVDSESVRITAQGDVLLYTANPSGQTETIFTATSVTDSSVTFANPAHDFPTRVSYRRASTMGLHAEIAGPSNGAERVMAFPYAAAVCRDS